MTGEGAVHNVAHNICQKPKIQNSSSTNHSIKFDLKLKTSFRPS